MNLRNKHKFSQKAQSTLSIYKLLFLTKSNVSLSYKQTGMCLVTFKCCAEDNHVDWWIKQGNIMLLLYKMGHLLKTKQLNCR